VRWKDDNSLYDFSRNLRHSQRAIINGKGKIHYTLGEDRVAALDAIGFEWGKSAGGSTVRKSFFERVEELSAYKEKHGHLDVSRKEDLSLYNFCRDVRKARQGKGNYRLDDGRIAALDATGFDWKLEAGASSTVSSNKDIFFSRVDRLRTYKEKHGHLNVSGKEDRSLYDFSRNLRQSRKAIINGKGKIHYTLGEDRVAALDAIGFDWIESAGASSTMASKDDMHHSRDGFDWKLGSGSSSSMVSKDDGAKEKMGSKENSFFARLDEMKAYKEKHGRYVQIRH
jgi:hypothetical protein